MRSIFFGSSNQNPPQIAILTKSTGLNQAKIENHYITPSGLNPELFVVWELGYDTPKKVSAKYVKMYLADLLPEIFSLGIKTLFVTDGTYFKYLTGMGKVDPYYGEVMP